MFRKLVSSGGFGLLGAALLLATPSLAHAQRGGREKRGCFAAGAGVLRVQCQSRMPRPT